MNRVNPGQIITPLEHPHTECPKCGYNMAPEPLYDLETAIVLIPMVNTHTLRKYLSAHRAEFPPRYRKAWEARMRGLRRVLTATEIKKIRERFVYERKYRKDKTGTAEKRD